MVGPDAEVGIGPPVAGVRLSQPASTMVLRRMPTPTLASARRDRPSAEGQGTDARGPDTPRELPGTLLRLVDAEPGARPRSSPRVSFW